MPVPPTGVPAAECGTYTFSEGYRSVGRLVHGEWFIGLLRPVESIESAGFDFFFPAETIISLDCYG